MTWKWAGGEGLRRFPKLKVASSNLVSRSILRTLPPPRTPLGSHTRVHTSGSVHTLGCLGIGQQPKRPGDRRPLLVRPDVRACCCISCVTCPVSARRTTASAFDSRIRSVNVYRRPCTVTRCFTFAASGHFAHARSSVFGVPSVPRRGRSPGPSRTPAVPGAREEPPPARADRDLDRDHPRRAFARHRRDLAAHGFRRRGSTALFSSRPPTSAPTRGRTPAP